jgi:hypothetical protein
LAQTRFARSIASKPFIQMIFITGGTAHTWLRSNNTTREATFSPDPSPFGRPLLLHNSCRSCLTSNLSFLAFLKGKTLLSRLCEVSYLICFKIEIARLDGGLAKS